MRWCAGPQRRRAGFTLIEVLMVVVLLGVLAKLTTTTWLYTRLPAYDTAMTSDMHELALAEDVYFNTNSGWALGTTDHTSSALTDGTTTLDFRASEDVGITVAANGLGYDMTATHAKNPGRTCTVSVVPGLSRNPRCSGGTAPAW